MLNTNIFSGYFPYLFNERENENYKGPYPEADRFCPSQMSRKARNAFYKWYNEHKTETFDMQLVRSSYVEAHIFSELGMYF